MHCVRPFEQAIRTALERPTGPLRAVELVALFDGRARYDAIQLWRYGHRKAPQWAVELLQSRALAKLHQATANALSIEPSRHNIAAVGAKALRAYNARRAKEKAALAQGDGNK